MLHWTIRKTSTYSLFVAQRERPFFDAKGRRYRKRWLRGLKTESRPVTRSIFLEFAASFGESVLKIDRDKRRFPQNSHSQREPSLGLVKVHKHDEDSKVSWTYWD